MGVFALVAEKAPVAIVFRRIRSKRWRLARWRFDEGTLEPGAVFEGQLYPRRCSISPDGELLYYFAMSWSSGEFAGQGPGQKQFSAISKAPWLTALVAWREIGTYTSGFHFVPGSSELGYLGEPEHGSARPLLAKYGLAPNERGFYATERRTGWVEVDRLPSGSSEPSTPPRFLLAKSRPTGPERLLLTDPHVDPSRPRADVASSLAKPRYALELGDEVVPIPEAAWADWDRSGRLLVATDDGLLQVREVEGTATSVTHKHDLSALGQASQTSPEWARRW